jgi:hypothetical protein
MERAGIADARVPRYYAKLDESASVEAVDVAGASVKRTRIDDSVMDPFHVDAEGQPVYPTTTQPADRTATQIGTTVQRSRQLLR